MTAKRGDLAIIHSVSRVAVNGGSDYDSHDYRLTVVTSVTRDGAVKAVRELHRPDSTPVPVARMARHTMVTVPAAVCDLAAIAQHVATVRTRTADAGYSYIPNHDSPVELLRDLAPRVSDPSAIATVRAAAVLHVRESIDFCRAHCERCGVRMGDGAGTVADDSDGCPVAVCRECPRGVNFTTAYPRGLDVTVTRGYAQHMTTRIERTVDHVVSGYYAGRSYVVTLDGYGTRTLTEECFAPLHVPAERYAVTRETSQPVEVDAPADGSQPVADGGASSQPATVEVATVAPVETSRELAQPATVAQPVEVAADGGEVNMAALTAALAAIGWDLAADGTVTDAGTGYTHGGGSRGELTHGAHAELLTVLGDRQGADMMRVAGALELRRSDKGTDKVPPHTAAQTARLRMKIRAGVRGPAIAAVGDDAPAVRGAGTVETVPLATVPADGATVEVDGRRGRVLRSEVASHLDVWRGAKPGDARAVVFFPADGGASLPAPVEAQRAHVSQPVETSREVAQPVAETTAAPADGASSQPVAAETVTCPAPACGRAVRVTRDGRYGSHRSPNLCAMSGKPVGSPAPASRVVFAAQPAATVAPAPVADSGDYPHAAILRELAGRSLAGRVKVTRRDGAWSYRAPLADGGEVAGRAVWSEESAAWVVCEVVPTVPAPVRPVMPPRVAAALARITSQPVAPVAAAQPVAVPAPPVAVPVAPRVAAPAPLAPAPVLAPVAVPAAPGGDRGRYAYAPGTRVRATLREVRRELTAAQRAPETAPLFAGVVCTVEADRPTVAQPVGAVVVSVEAPAGVDLAAVWAVVDGIAARHVPAAVLAAV